MCLVPTHILTNVDHPRFYNLGVRAFKVKKHVLTSIDLCVTFDLLCLTTLVVVHTRILLIKFGKN